MLASFEHLRVTTWRAQAGLAAAVAMAATSASPAWANTPMVEDLSKLSIEELASIDVSSVSKSLQPLSDAPAAIYVITHEDAVRSGATNLAEILRLAPNLHVARLTANSYAISARGFNGTAADKLLVLIDGRSVYTPFSHGVFWDAQDTPAEIIERVEVISGPGATLWGANAVNGVINVVTRRTAADPGGALQVGAGDNTRRVGLQYGGASANKRPIAFTFRASTTTIASPPQGRTPGTAGASGKADSASTGRLIRR